MASGVHAAAEGVAALGISAAEWAEPCPALRRNLRLLSHDQVELARMLLNEGQGHLFEHWPEPGVDDDKKKSFFDQVCRLNSSYPGGLAAYIQNAKKLLADSKAGQNPYDGFTPSVPSGEALTFGDDNFVSLEAAGVKEARNAAFVLVAGGLGERLGYKGIKVALPRETTTGKCFLQHYIESILSLQEASCKMEGECHTKIPFAIMTSDDTNALTIKLLESNSYFGMEPSQVKILKQEKVACLADNDARLALDPNDKYKIQTKPHGHGDVHSLLYSSGLLEQWKSTGRRWVLFFQDTNGLLFNAIPSALGVSATKGYNVNSLAVPRKAKEAIGGITKLTHVDGRTMVINVEYNQLDPLLRATGHPDGDANCETGYSPYPGNINQLILELGPYIEELKKTHGAISEFVNPKYTDSTKTAFKSSTRLECMMQDYPKTLPPTAKVGFTVMDTWLAYAPVKNNPEDAAKVPKGNPFHSATSGEMAIYRANSLILRKAGAQISDPVVSTFNGQEVEVWPRVTWSPRWGLMFKDVKRKVHGNSSISQRSFLVINGHHTHTYCSRRLRQSTLKHSTMGSMGNVRIQSRRMVRPEPTASRLPEPETTIHLTPWDLKHITVEHIQKGVLLPKPPTTGGHVDVERLASSFARALGRFYPYAGRLAVSVAPHSQSLTISLRCSGEGAEFIQAVAPGVTVADVTASLVVPRVVWSFFPLDTLLGADAAAGTRPVLAAQVTELADGVFIALTMNHGVADGTTFWHFFNTWSELSRAGDDVMISTPLPVFDRSFLGSSCAVPIPLPFGKLEDVVGQRVHVFPPVQECFLHFSAASVKELKAKANAEVSSSGTDSTISSLQALLAHLWRAVCRARQLTPEQETAYIVLVGFRGRVGGIPASYAGNAVGNVTAKSTAGDIVGKGLGWAAWLLNRAVASWDEASTRDKLASWPQEPSFTSLPAFVAAVPTGTFTGSSPRFDVYGNDFGWGAPVAVRSGSGNKVDGKVTVYAGRGGGGSMALEVCLAPEALARLVADEEFMNATSTVE